jgi:hypothetical protein
LIPMIRFHKVIGNYCRELRNWNSRVEVKAKQMLNSIRNYLLLNRSLGVELKP